MGTTIETDATIRTAKLVEALSQMSPLARQKIRATLEDMSQEITWNYWSRVFQGVGGGLAAEGEQKACGCYEMEDEDYSNTAARMVAETANTYDQYVKHSKRLLVKRVHGVEVLRTPARRRLIKLVDKAEAMAKVRQ